MGGRRKDCDGGMRQQLNKAEIKFVFKIKKKYRGKNGKSEEGV